MADSKLSRSFPTGKRVQEDLNDILPSTNGTITASKIVVPDTNANIGVVKCTAFHIGATGSETQVTSTGAELNILDGVTATTSEINQACDKSAMVETLTDAGANAVTAGINELFLDNDTTAITATIADAADHQGIFRVRASSEPAGGEDHTLTLTSGTFNGTNNVATFADIQDELIIHFDSTGRGTVVVNTGTVALS